MSSTQLKRFWHGELPRDMRVPNEPYVALVTWEHGTNGPDKVHSYFMSPTRLSERAIPKHLVDMPSRERFEALRFLNLAEGFFSVEGTLSYPPLFDAGGMPNDIAARIHVAEPQYGQAEAVAAMRERSDWITMPGWPAHAGRLLAQIGPRSADLLPAGRSAWPDGKDAADVRRDLGSYHRTRLERGTTSDTPVMLIDTLFSWRKPHLYAVDLLALDGNDIRELSFLERQRLLKQEIGELRGNGMAPDSLVAWTPGTPADAAAGVMCAAAESAYGHDLISSLERPL